MFVSEEDKKKILQAADGRLLDVLLENANLARRGASYYGTCPECKDEASLTFNEKKSIFKCFKCGFGGKDPVGYWMKQGKKYHEALELLAQQFNVWITPPEHPVKKSIKGSYCKTMLTESGLTPKDVEAKIMRTDTNRTTTVGRVFRSGTINGRGEIVDGDDVIIEYYDLEGNPVQYEEIDKNGRATGAMKDYFRVRWQHPNEHLDKNGRPFKYKSPPRSGSFIYIPESIRMMFRNGEKIDRLFIQEGEKKAEKACKHDIPSVAISGIHNLGRNGVLHEDLVKIITALEVKELVLLFDADWNEISNNLTINDFADQRPRSFFTAAKNFKEYCVQLRNSRSLYLELFIGHIKENQKGDKGIDDLLVNTLKGKEEDLKADVDHLINERNLTGQYLQLHKITTMSDAKLYGLWSLDNYKDFALKHKEKLKDLPEFRIGKYRWRFNDKGEVESAQPIEEDEKYWLEEKKEDRHGNIRTEYKFRYERSFRFLQNRGFGRFRTPDGGYTYVRVEHPFVETIHQHEEIRDFIKDFTREIANEDVLEMLHRGGPQFLGPEKLSNLRYVTPAFENPSRDRQLFYFKDACWEIRKDGVKEIDYTAIGHQLWADQRHDIAAKRTHPLLTEVSRDESDGTFSYKLSNTGRQCHFLRFLENASNFTWRREKMGETISEQDRRENDTHLISKLCAIGYLMMSAKDKGVTKAVVAMDGKQSEVGDSNGRSGKSLVGVLLEEVKNVVYINGKHKDIETDPFLWHDVNVKTEVVLIDDVRTNFSLEFLFANITGNWAVNYKGGGRATFPFHQSPKIYLTTNHALNGEGGSFYARQWQIAFSDFYNEKHEPKDDFGILFFDDWDYEQWNLTWNMLAECVQLYLKYGVVEAPGERIKLRMLRQQISESLLAWADEYFSDTTKLNIRLTRKELQDNYFEYDPNARKYTSTTSFKKRLKKYCEYRGYLFNPNLTDPETGKPTRFNEKDGTPIMDDKSGGVEYFTIGDVDGNWVSESRMKELEDRGELPFQPADERDKPF